MQDGAPSSSAEYSSELSGMLAGDLVEEASLGRLGLQHGTRAKADNVSSSPARRRKRPLQLSSSATLSVVEEMHGKTADASKIFVSVAASVGHSTISMAANSGTRQNLVRQMDSLDASGNPPMTDLVIQDNQPARHSESSCLNTMAISKANAVTGIMLGGSSSGNGSWLAADLLSEPIRPQMPHLVCPSLGVPRLTSWQPPVQAVAGAAGIAARPGPRLGPRTGGSDLSSVMHMIATALREKEAAAAAAAVMPMHSLLKGAVSAPDSKGAVGRSFCRMDMSHEMSVISAGWILVYLCSVCHLFNYITITWSHSFSFESFDIHLLHELFTLIMFSLFNDVQSCQCL